MYCMSLRMELSRIRRHHSPAFSPWIGRDDIQLLYSPITCLEYTNNMVLMLETGTVSMLSKYEYQKKLRNFWQNCFPLPVYVTEKRTTLPYASVWQIDDFKYVKQ